MPPSSEKTDDTPSTTPVNPSPDITQPILTPEITPPAAGKEPESRKPETTTASPLAAKEPGGIDALAPEAGSADAGQTGDEPQTQKTEVKVGNGTVIVTVVCEEEKCTAAVADAEAVVNAVLMPEQQEIVNGGKTIEIRIDVTDISDQVPGQDKEVIESGNEAYREEVPQLVLGMYVDISMFIRIGAGAWNAMTATDELIEVVVDIPGKLRSDGREFYIIRAHEGEYTFMSDMDDEPDTITVSTDMFSSYAIAYVETDETGADEVQKCGLCHICPTFLGMQSFILVFDDAEEGLLQASLKEMEKEEYLLKQPLQWTRSTAASIEYPLFSNEEVVQIPDHLAKEQPHFSGWVKYETKITVPQTEKVLLTISDAYEGVEVFVNGVSAGVQVVPVYRFDITDLLHEGENAISIEVSTTLERERAFSKNRTLLHSGTADE